MPHGAPAPATPALYVTSATLPARPAAATSPATALAARDAFPLARALEGLWALNAATVNVPAGGRKGCPVLPRAVKVADGFDGLVVESAGGEAAFHHAGGSATECPYLKKRTL
jgi:hypothetical protein